MQYDELAAAYARHRGAYPPVVEALACSLWPKAMVLEIGCGTANHLVAVAELAGCPCVGVDASAGMLSFARRTGTLVALVRGRAEGLPLRDGSVDLAFSVDVIHHVGDVASYFVEAARVLKPGGRLCTVTDSDATIRGRVQSAYFPAIVDAELARYPSIAALERAAWDAGLTVETPLTVEARQAIKHAGPFRDKAYSSLHLISEDEYAAGLEHLERDLATGPLEATSRCVLLWATAPSRASG